MIMWRKAGFFLLVLVAASTQPAGAQKNIGEPGPYHHRFANAVFPASFGGYERQQLSSYDDAGRDVGANYNFRTTEGRLNMSVYIYPAPAAAKKADRVRACKAEFDSVNGSIAQANGGARPVAEGGAIRVRGVQAKLSHRSLYRYETYFDDHVQPVQSEAHLFCYVGGNWFVKYRITTPEAVRTQRPVEDFIRRGPWPGRGSAETIALAY
jgi:hypothetical protein